MSRSAESDTCSSSGLMPLFFICFGQQVLLGDGDLLVLGVAGQSDHFHAVEQRRRDVHGVGRGHEHHVRQVVLDLDVVVDERVVLLRIEHLEQAPTTDRRGSPGPSCRLRRAGTAGCARRPWSCSAGSCRASSRCRCGGGRGSPPRRARRRATCGRTCGRSRARSTDRARSCRRPADRRGTGSAPSGRSTRCWTARYSTMRSLTFSRP